ncbi:MAG: hypothetical protein K8R02_05375 [Anaerohalosphaeraceae bacterium]|nr:hypothetical protein [Anaerohalosphaeraceae bacterium]
MKRKMKNNRKIKIKNLSVAAIFMLSTVAAIVIGQTDANEVGTDVLLEQKGAVAYGQMEAVAADVAIDGDMVQSINFSKDMSIRDALRFLAAKYRKNIIPSTRVNGQLNVTSLYEVTFAQALSAILGNDFKYDVEGNFIKIYGAEEYQKIKENKSRLTSKVFTLYYVNAAEVKLLITPVLSGSGKISTTTAAAVDTEAGTGGDTMSMRDMVSVYDFPERIEKISEMIEQIDVRPSQVLIEVTILQAKLNETTQFGINWNSIKGLAVEAGTNGFAFGTTSGLTDTGGHGLTVGFNHSKIESLITASESVTDTTVLANPKIMALNKQAGYINIGEERGYNESITDNSSGTQTTSVAFLESGTILKFRPYICDDGNIRMEINPEESTADLQDNGIPIKTITTVKTNIMAKDGETIIIGGLFKDNLTNGVTQVPVVGDLPIIGTLFKNQSDTNVRTELVILITPHIINEPKDTLANERKADIDRIVEGSRKRMMSVSRARVYEDRYNKAVKLYEDGKYEKALNELNWIIGFRPNALEAVQLKEIILAKTDIDKYENIERRSLERMSKELDEKWIRR